MRICKEGIMNIQYLGLWKSMLIDNRYFIIEIFIDRYKKLYYCVSEFLKDRRYPDMFDEDYGVYNNPREAMRKIKKEVGLMTEKEVQLREGALMLAQLGDV